jgi:CubicO group peptidase (beta-lactamase class C family)
MYLVAGIVLERISGQRWEDFIRDRILLPLGMERATTSLEDMLARHSDYAAPHAVLSWTTSSGAFQSARSIRDRVAASAPQSRRWRPICASISTRSQGGEVCLLSPGAVAELTSPQSYVGRSDFAEVGQLHYGFGFEVVSHRGARRVSHGGGWSGYNCDLRLLPDYGSGVMVLTNGDDSGRADRLPAPAGTRDGGPRLSGSADRDLPLWHCRVSHRDR